MSPCTSFHIAAVFIIVWSFRAVVGFHTSSLGSLESHLAPAILSRDVFVYASLTNSSRVCVSRTTGTASLAPASFSSLDNTFGLLRNLRTRLVIGELNVFSQCYVSLSTGSCIAFLQSTASDCFLDAGQAVSYNQSVAGYNFGATSSVPAFQSYLSDWAIERARLRSFTAISASIATDCGNVLSMVTSVLPSEQPIALQFAISRFQNHIISPARANVASKWKYILTMLPRSTFGVAAPCASVVFKLALLMSSTNAIDWTDDVQSVMLDITEQILSATDDELQSTSLCAALALGVTFTATDDFAIRQRGALSIASLSDIQSLCAGGAITERKATLLEILSSRIGAILSPVQTAARTCVFYWFSSSTAPSNNASVLDCFPPVPQSASTDITFDLNSTTSVVSVDANASFAVHAIAAASERPLTIFVAGALGSHPSDFSSDFVFQGSDLSKAAQFNMSLLDSPTASTPLENTAVDNVCPKGWYYFTHRDTGVGMCRQCQNQSPEYIFCPGDNLQHLCSNKPLEGTSYIAQGAGFSSSDCPFYCQANEYRVGNTCATAPIGFFPDSVSTVAPCLLPASIQAIPSLRDQAVFVSSGFRLAPKSCRFGLRRRATSEPSQSAVDPLMYWCSEAISIGASGVSWTLDLILNTSKFQAALIPTSVFELASVGPDRWGIYLAAISYTPTQLTMQLYFTSAADASPHFSPTFSVQAAAVGGGGNVPLRVAVSIDYDAGLLMFMVDDYLVGPPRMFSAVRTILTQPCAGSLSSKFTLGGRLAFLDINPVSMYANGDIATMPLNLTYFPGRILSFSMRQSSLSMLFPSLQSVNQNFAEQPPSAESVLFAPAVSVAALSSAASAIDALFGVESRQSTIFNSCRWLSYLSIEVPASCEACPTGSIGSQISPTAPGNPECECLPTRHKSIAPCNTQQCSCLVNRLPYAAPSCVVHLPLAPNPSILPMGSRTLLMSCQITAPLPADATSIDPGLISFSFSCSNNLTLISQSVEAQNMTASLSILYTASFGSETCTLTASVKVEGRTEGALFTASVLIVPKVLPIDYSNLNVANGTMLLEGSSTLDVTVANYSFFAPSMASLLGGPRVSASAIAIVQSAVDSASVELRLASDPSIQTTLKANGTMRLLLPSALLLAGAPMLFTISVFSTSAVFTASDPLILVIFPFEAARVVQSPTAEAIGSSAAIIIIALALVVTVIVAVVLKYRQLHPPVAPNLNSSQQFDSSGRYSHRSPRPRQSDGGASPSASYRSRQASTSGYQSPRPAVELSPQRTGGSSRRVEDSPQHAQSSQRSTPQRMEWDRSVANRRERPWKEAGALPPTSREQRRDGRGAAGSQYTQDERRKVDAILAPPQQHAQRPQRSPSQRQTFF